MPNYLPPHVRASLTEGTSASRAYYQWFNLVASSLSSLESSVGDVKTTVATLPSGAISEIKSSGSISVKVSDGVARIGLMGDYVDAGYTRYYGTDPTGARGFFAVSDAFADSANVAKTVNSYGVTTFDLTDLANTGTGSLLAITRDGKGRVTGTRDATITGTAGRVTVANGDASAGLPTIDLATVADTGGGALLRFVKDAWGRITGTSAATTDDLAEGTANRYAQSILDDLIVSSSGKPLVTSSGDFITTSAA